LTSENDAPQLPSQIYKDRTIIAEYGKINDIKVCLSIVKVKVNNEATPEKEFPNQP